MSMSRWLLGRGFGGDEFKTPRNAAVISPKPTETSFATFPDRPRVVIVELRFDWSNQVSRRALCPILRPASIGLVEKCRRIFDREHLPNFAVW